MPFVRNLPQPNTRQHLSVAAIFQQVILFVGKCMERHDSHKRTKDAFVDSNTTYAEVGGVKVVNPNGTCLSCDSQAVACCRILMTFWHLEHPSRVGSCLRVDELFLSLFVQLVKIHRVCFLMLFAETLGWKWQFSAWKCLDSSRFAPLQTSLKSRQHLVSSCNTDFHAVQPTHKQVLWIFV